jgi:hypothetical protein
VCGHTYRDTAGTIPLRNLTCGGLNLGGGVASVGEGPTPDGSTNRLTVSCNGSSCTLGATSSPGTQSNGNPFDCTDTGCRFGTPLPIVNGTLSVCVENKFSAPVSGSLDTSTGVTSESVSLTSHTVVTAIAAQPCPICRQTSVTGPACVGSTSSPCHGFCEGSSNQGAACVSTNSQGLSRDCPGVASDASGSKCYKGTNNGAACTSNSQCPGGVCAVFVGDIPVNLAPLTTGSAEKSDAGGLFCTGVGQAASQKGAFLTAICLGGTNTGKPCTAATAATDCPGGSCRAGTLNNYCVGGANDGKGCSGATDCPSPGTCVKAGTVAELIRETGSPSGPIAVGTPASMTLATVFCVPATGNLLIDGASNFPGPGATSLPGKALLQ